MDLQAADYSDPDNLLKLFEFACRKGHVPEIVAEHFESELVINSHWNVERRKNIVLTASVTTKCFWNKAEQAAIDEDGVRDDLIEDLFFILCEAGIRTEQYRKEKEADKNRKEICKTIDKLIEQIDKEPVAKDLAMWQIINAMSSVNLEKLSGETRKTLESQLFPTATQYLQGLKNGFQKGFHYDPEKIIIPKGYEANRHANFLTEVAYWFRNRGATVPEAAAFVVRKILKARNLDVDTTDDIDLKDAAVRRFRRFLPFSRFAT